MWIVLLVVLLDIIGFGIISPVFPFFAEELGASPELITLCMAIYTGTLFISAPILGRLSDRYGRKPIMALSMLGAVIGYLLLASAESIWMVVVSRVLSGIMAGNFAAAQAYIADSTTEQERAKYMGYFGGMMGLGFVVGPALGSWLGGRSFENANFTTPALTAAVLCLIAFFAVLLFVKESLPAHLRGAQQTNHQPPLLQAIGKLRDRSLLVKVILCGALYQIAGGFYETIYPLWAAACEIIDGPRGMLPMLLASGLSFIVVMSVLVAPLSKRFGERKLLMFGGLVMALAAYAITVSGTYSSRLWVTIFMMVISAAAGFIMASGQILLSRCAAEHERGMVMGVAAAAGMLGKTVTTALSGVLFNQVHYHSPYYAAILMALVLFWVASLIEDLPTDDYLEFERG